MRPLFAAGVQLRSMIQLKQLSSMIQLKQLRSMIQLEQLERGRRCNSFEIRGRSSQIKYRVGVERSSNREITISFIAFRRGVITRTLQDTRRRGTGGRRALEPVITRGRAGRSYPEAIGGGADLSLLNINCSIRRHIITRHIICSSNEAILRRCNPRENVEVLTRLFFHVHGKKADPMNLHCLLVEPIFVVQWLYLAVDLGPKVGSRLTRDKKRAMTDKRGARQAAGGEGWPRPHNAVS
ncbi:unnamed protein product [Nezara viridula]|uniref:Uncharacterized protein n=1 Tax=Nezara viridula TaxID=85310 RepID=A0A9P0MTL9_NEZVI|nr:unnamed protein product [Nezara viridula]